MIGKIRKSYVDNYGETQHRIYEFDKWLYYELKRDFIEEKVDMQIDTITRLITKMVELNLLTVQEVIDIVGDYKAKEYNGERD